MAAQFARAPHQSRMSMVTSPQAPNAALLIDFDNVTMGIRNDLSKEIKSLLNSDIIKGKVAVQRAYADWRRYPQYIVPLSEASVDLIFAPAYGSAKKNATDIRLAIDALELVFVRPEIGTYILLSGDSDFSSLVLKLKEYGKYVIGVGLRESASDLLVQNCDEYYSYSALSGLTRAADEDLEKLDPWHLTEKAVQQMVEKRDVMRSDRLKQVMLQIDPNFNEKDLGFSKFSRFLSDAAKRGRLKLKKHGNGQWEVAPAGDEPATEAVADPKPRRSREERPRDDGRRSRGGRTRSERDRAEAPAEKRGAAKADTTAEPAAQAASADTRSEKTERTGRDDRRREARQTKPADDINTAYALLRRAIKEVIGDGRNAARDSDVKRRMLEIQPGWDESTLGFSKFSRFLRQAHDVEVIDLKKSSNGVYEVVTRGDGTPKPSTTPRAPRTAKTAKAETKPEARPKPKAEAEPKKEAEAKEESRATKAAKPRTSTKATKAAAKAKTSSAKDESKETSAAPSGRGSLGIGFRRGTRGSTGPEGPPPLLPGQAVASVDEMIDDAKPAEDSPAKDAKSKKRAPAKTSAKKAAAKASPKKTTAKAPAKKKATKKAGAASLAERLELPTDEGSVKRYLASRYKGVGRRTAETLVEELGADRVFDVLHTDEDRIRELLGARRAEAAIAAWQSDYAQRNGSAEAPVAKKTSSSTRTAPKARKSSSRRGRRKVAANADD